MSTFGFETTGQEVVQAFNDQVKGKTILITGASNGGLGAEAAIALAAGSPAHLVLLARSAAKVDPVIEKINEIDPNIATTFVPVELDDFDSVRAAAAKVNAAIDKLHILINNAGIMAVREFTTNKAGIEMQFATNHLGHFLLTKLVFDKIKAAGPGARIINLTSGGHGIGPFREDKYNFDNGKDYDPWSAYGQSKTANILFSRQLSAKLQSQGITSFATHPGFIATTSLANHLSMEDFGSLDAAAMKNTGKHFTLDAPKTIDQGIATALRAALDPSLAEHAGAYMKDCTVTEPCDHAKSAESAEALWGWSEKLVGEKFEL